MRGWEKVGRYLYFSHLSYPASWISHSALLPFYVAFNHEKIKRWREEAGKSGKQWGSETNHQIGPHLPILAVSDH